MSATAQRVRTVGRAPQVSADRPKSRLRLVHESRRSVRRSAVVSVLALTALLFGAMSMWVSVIGGQGRLDDLRSQIAETQERHSELVTAQNEAQSPDEILRIAEEELGMIPPGKPELVTPSAEIIAPSPPSVADTPIAALVVGDESELAEAAAHG